MANYIKATNFAAKDALPSGNSGKIIKGTEIDVEFTAIASAITSKADTNSPTFTGTPAGPTAAAGTNTTQLATTAFVNAAAAASFPVGGIIMWSGSIATIPAGWVLCDGSNSTPDLRSRFIVGAGSTYSVGTTGGSADAIVVSHTHTFSGTTSTAGSHQHGFTNFLAPDNQGGSKASITNFDNTGNSSYLTDSAGDHSHSFSGTTASTGSSGTNANLPPYYALAFIMKTA